MLGKPRRRLNNLRASLRFPCRGLNPIIDSINPKNAIVFQEGTISSWGVDLKLQRFLKTGTDSCKARDLWVTHFVVLQNVNKIALAFTSKEIGK